MAGAIALCGHRHLTPGFDLTFPEMVGILTCSTILSCIIEYTLLNILYSTNTTLLDTTPLMGMNDVGGKKG